MREFHYISNNKPADWEKGVHHNLLIDEKGIRIQQTRKYGVRTVFALEEVLPDERVADFALGGSGKLYLLDERTNVWTYDSLNRHTEILFREGHDLFTAAACMSYVTDAVVFAEPEEGYPIQAFSSTNAQTIWSLNSWNGIGFTPCTIESDMQNYVYALVRLDNENGELVILRINRHGEITASYRHDRLNSKLTSTAEIGRSWQIDASPAGEVYALDTEFHTLLKFAPEGHLLYRLLLPTEGKLSSIACDSGGYLYFGSGRTVDRYSEDNRFILKYDSDGRPESSVTAFRGRVGKLIIDPYDRMAVLNEEDRTITMLVSEPKTKEMTGTGLLEGVFLATALDSGEPETVWHKLQLEANIPDSTQIRIYYYASDHKVMNDEGRLIDRDEFLLDKDVGMEEKLASWRELDAKSIVNPQDALFFDARGRYLWLMIELAGSEGHSPLLSKLRIYFPRQSILRFLPGVYAEEDKNGFLDRFLSLFGTFFLELDERIDHIAQYFDPEAVSGDYLRWLGGWVGITADDHWSDGQLRAWIAAAPELYRMRGTREGIERMIEMYIGEKPIIIEYHQLKELRANSDFSEMANELYSMDPYTFCVLIKSERMGSEKERAIVEKLIDEQKPAFTECKLIALQPWMYMDMHTYLGINTFLSEPTLMRLDNKSSMPNNTTLIDVDLDNRLDTHTRIGLDSELE